MRFKRGAIEVQFNWLFVLIIGAVILMVFSGIIIRQKNISETSTNAMILDNLDTILSGTETSAGTINIIRVPDRRIEFSCNSYVVGDLSKQVDVMNVFTPESLQDTRLISMTLDFSMPYRITNMIYLTSPKHRYIFIGQNHARTLRNQMPNETFTEYFSNINQVDYRGEESARLIFFDSPPVLPQDFSSVPDEAVTALYVRGDESTGTVGFYEKSGNGFVETATSSYIGEKSLLGAVFSGDKELYECVMEDVFEKTNVVTQIYTEKTKALISSYTQTNDRCSRFTSTIYSIDPLERISAASSSFTQTNIDEMLSAASLLKNQNRQAQLQSCATIY